TDLIAGILGTSQLSVIYGQPGCGKTFLGLDLALHIASDEDKWMDRRVGHGPAIYLAIEAGKSLNRRVFAWRLHHHYTQLPGLPFFAVQVPLDLCTANNDIAPLITAINRTCGRTPPALIVVDTVNRAMAGGNENSSEDMGALVNAANILRAEFD